MPRAALKPNGDDSRYRLLLEAITDYAIYMLDAQGRVSSWNAGAERFKGYTASEILGQHFSRFYTEEDRANELPQRVLRTAESEGRFEGEGWRVRKDGSRFWAHVAVDPIRSPTGTLLGYAKITCDLTEKRAADEALRQSQEQFRLLVQGVTDYAIYMLDSSGRVASWNAGARRIKGYEPDEIVGEHFSRFYTEEDRATDLPRRALETAEREGRFEHEGWRVRKDGSRFWASVIVDPIWDDAGQLIGFAKVTRDITEKREAQQALERVQEELLQSRKMEALGQLAGGIAHDFNNLLMAITGSLELLQKRVPDDPRITRLLDNALQGAHRGAALTTRMLAFSRRQPLEPQEVDLPALVRGLGDLLRLSMGGNIAIESRAPFSVLPVMVDPNQLELALLNVAANARDAMPQGGTLTISISSEEVPLDEPAGLKAGSYVRLSVSDTGEGMDETTLARAVDPFFTTKGPGEGTGLGLSTVHGLLEDSGGRLVLASSKGEGTTVEMWLPAAVASHSVETGPLTSATEDAPGQAPLTVLAVDDDELVLMNTVIMLEDLGYQVIEARSGAEALQLLSETKVDLVITDQGMPRMSGTELAAAARQTHPGLPVILATGYLDLPKEAEDLGLPKLDKPFSQDQLQAIIREKMK
ncbi:sensory box histidine kinase/response regulator [Rubellimicrobium mesophilum DSM 19309]|uniref:histidine kinase n=1 Tax=Rubellimicrobium mesophilum DSM 19309 TaxID=442562 RepID=A0A017HAX5_9RHOB|nr:PAS domain-containing sensor histidine kinase [Rubellimicrobium mesophilum]EYD71516.1 sensory box histidine kinase/response regulator [Rubellimicrobium mesophilum DSM 19309]